MLLKILFLCPLAGVRIIVITEFTVILDGSSVGRDASFNCPCHQTIHSLVTLRPPCLDQGEFSQKYPLPIRSASPELSPPFILPSRFWKKMGPVSILPQSCHRTITYISCTKPPWSQLDSVSSRSLQCGTLLRLRSPACGSLAVPGSRRSLSRSLFYVYPHITALGRTCRKGTHRCCSSRARRNERMWSLDL